MFQPVMKLFDRFNLYQIRILDFFAQAYSIGDHEEDHDSMPQLPRILLLLHSHRAKHGVFFILDEASLVAAYVGKVSSFLGHSHPSVSCFYERNEVFLSLIIAWPISEIPDFESR